MRESNVRDKILDVASRLFYDQGYNLTGINQIIDEAEIARASLYNHFESKTELLLAYLEKTHHQWFEELDEFLAPFTTPREKLLAIFDFRLLRQQKLKYKGCHFSKIGAEASQHEIKVFALVKAHKERLRNTIGGLVDQAKHRQLLSNELLTDTLFLLLEGGITTGSVYRSSQALKNAKRAAEALL
ncbi:MAG: TetR/AcrR family transcriptional regulator [Chitinophagaceae bacterium]|nr:TetR/AcrR family transcriptional regulator [Chitinophagaceae bacterium]